MLNIKTVRKDNGYTQAEVAKYLSITRAAYTNIENGRSDPNTATLLKLADFFDCSVDLLLGRTKKPGEPLVSDGQTALAQLLARLDQQQFAPDELALIRDYRLISKRDQRVVRALIKTLLKED